MFGEHLHLHVKFLTPLRKRIDLLLHAFEFIEVLGREPRQDILRLTRDFLSEVLLCILALFDFDLELLFESLNFVQSL